MKNNKHIFHRDFKVKPFWWEAYQPAGYELVDLPKRTSVAIVGAGYSGLAAALELHKHNVECVVLDANEPGFGASTRSGGLITASGGIKTPLVNRDYSPEDFRALIKANNDGIDLVEQIIQKEKIQCEWQKTGFLKLANTDAQFNSLMAKAEQLKRHQNINVQLVSKEHIGDQIGSLFYKGGLLTKQAAHLHPALYYQGLLRACVERQIAICKQALVVEIQKRSHKWFIKSSRGDIEAENVIIATNGYTGNVTPQFKRRLIPIKAYIIATEVLSDNLAKNLSPDNLSFAEARRIAPFFRLTGQSGQQRMIFGSRVKWKDIAADEMAPLLYTLLLDRFPQLEGTKISHAWSGNVALTLDEKLHLGKLDGLHYALGCNGSGVANMTYLGTQIARKIANVENYQCIYDNGDFPQNKFYNGNQRWFIPLIGIYLQARDWLDKKTDA